MKKKVLLAMAILATACLTGCNLNVSFTPDEPASGMVSEAESEDIKVTENESGSAQTSGNNSGTAVETSKAIQIDFESVYESNDNPFLWSVSYEYPVLDNEQYPELSLAIQDYRMAYVRNIEAARDE